MIIKILLLLTGLSLLLPVKSQNLIGMNVQQIEKEIKVHYPNFVIDNSFVNNSYKYLKYIDKINEQTLLVFLSDNNECTSTKLICDYSMLDQVKEEMKKYKTDKKDQWSYSVNGVQYLVKLHREEWFFSLSTYKK
jgi:hypothetical protein